MKKIDTKDKKKIAIISGIAVLVIAVIVLFATGVVTDLLAQWGVLKTKQVEPAAEFYQHVPKGDGDVIVLEDRILIADQAGVACYDIDGTWQWERLINLKSPVFIRDGEDKAVLGDVGGNGIYGFDKDGELWRYIFDTHIVNISESTENNKLVVIHGAENYLSAATLIDFTGEVKAVASRKFSRYYMMSASLSEEGKYAAIAGVTTDGGETSSVITFMKIDGYELYATETISGEILPIVSYMGDNLFAVGGDSLRKIYKVGKESSDENQLLWNRDGAVDTIVATYNSGDSLIAVSTADGAEPGMEASCKVSVYSSSGKMSDSFQCKGGINGIKSSGKMIAVYGENSVYLYNIYGHLIGEYNGVSQISDVEFLSAKELVVCGTSKIAKVDFS